MKTKEKKFVMTATALSSLKNILSTPVVCLEFFYFLLLMSISVISHQIIRRDGRRDLVV